MSAPTVFWSGIVIFVIALLAPLPLIRRSSTRGLLLSLFAQILGSLLFLGLSLSILISNQPLKADFYQIVSGMGFSFLIDRMAAFFIFLISTVALCSGIYSLQYSHHTPESNQGLVTTMTAAFVLSMSLAVASNNTFSLLFFWETMAISSFLLVMSEYKDKLTQKSGLFYFIMTQMSTVFLLFGFAVMYRVNGSFAIQPMGAITSGMRTLLFLFLFTGFGIKAGVMPFHKWLPYAHSASPSNISALMSGVMLKVAIYGMIRFILFTLQPELWWGIMMLAFGSVSALLGVIYALKDGDLKKMLAYSSIENIGIILLSLGLYVIFQAYNLPDIASLALAGGLFHTLNHALFKGLMFLTAGAVVHQVGTRNIEQMGGLVKKMTITATLFLIGAAAVSSLPPLNGFLSELMIFQALFQSFQIGDPLIEILLFISLAMLALTSALAVACFIKAFSTVFLAMPRSKAAEGATEVPKAMLIGPAVLAALCILLGVFSSQLLATAKLSILTPNLLPISIIMLVFIGLTIVTIRLTRKNGVRNSETWGCGQISQNSKMEYTASGFSEPLLTVFRPIYRTDKISRRRFSDENGTIFKDGEADIRTFKLFEERIYMPIAAAIRRFSEKVANIQDVDLDAHMLYAFIAVILLLGLAWWAL